LTSISSAARALGSRENRVKLFFISVAAMGFSGIGGEERGGIAILKPFQSALCLFWSRFCLLPQHMATTLPLAPAGNEQENAPSRLEASEGEQAQGLVPSPLAQQEEHGMALTAPVARLPVEMDVSVPVRDFRVRDLLALEPSHIIESSWGHGEDVPLSAGRVQLAWCEFEVIETQLAVRVTRLA
jgi:flagellar motor switch/type III secretory pathway protein FliN